MQQLLRGIPSNPSGTVQKGCVAQQGGMLLACLSICHIHNSVCYILSHHIAPGKPQHVKPCLHGKCRAEDFQQLDS